MPNDGYFDTVFAVGGDTTPVPDATDPGGLVSFQQGYTIGYEIAPGDPGSLPIERGKMNYLFNQLTAFAQFVQQGNAAPFITSTMNGGSPYTYPQFARVVLDGIAYQSIADSNTDTPPSAKWAVVLPGGSVGDITFGLSSTAPYGRLKLDASSIAKTSGATYNGAIYEALYTYLWTNCSSPSSNVVAPVNGGLGVSAAADFAANKRITLPTGADFVFMGIGSVITQAGATTGALTSTPAGSVSGSITINSFTLTAGQNGIHAHGILMYQNQPASTNFPAASSNSQSGTGTTENSGSGSSISPTGSMSASFSGSSLSIVQKSLGVYSYINYL